MHVVNQRRYIFRRRSLKNRLFFAALSSAAAVSLWSAQVAEAKPGGYQRPVVTEADQKALKCGRLGGAAGGQS